jgi:hypothetical protein
MNANGTEPKSCLGRVFNFKIGCFVAVHVLLGIYIHTLVSKVENSVQVLSC